MNVEVRQCVASDVLEILDAGAKQPGLGLDETTQEWARSQVENGPCVTMVCDGRIVGCSGLVILWPGVAAIWCLFVEDIETFAVPLIKRIKVQLKTWIDTHKLVRIQTPMRSDYPAGIRMAEWAGFTKESVMRKYFPDQTDGWLYTIVGD